MIATVNAHVRRLIQEKELFDTDLLAFKEKHKQKLQTLMTQCKPIINSKEGTFEIAKNSKIIWGHMG